MATLRSWPESMRVKSNDGDIVLQGERDRDEKIVYLIGEYAKQHGK